jgi:spore maturation protein CgeB
MDLIELNRDYIKNNTDKFIINKFSQNYDCLYKICPSKEETPGFEIVKNGVPSVIHSLYYPLKETEKNIESFVSNHKNLVVFGLGLAYHLFKLKDKYPDKQIIVIEPDKSLFNFVLSFLDLSSLPGIIYYIGFQDYELSQMLKKDDYDIFSLKSYQKLYANLFAMTEKRLLNKNLYDLSEIWKYKKFQSDQARIIFIDSSYVLTKECIRAIQQLGHLVHYIHIDNNSYDYELFIRNLMNDIAHFRPDFVLTVNHLGFDKEGRLTELLTEMEMPFVSWFVDSPSIILSCFSQNISDFCNIFVWDRDYIDDVKNAGYPHVDYLHLATHEEIFFHKPGDFNYQVSFVGSSMVYATHKNMRSFSHRPDLLNSMELVSDKFIELKSRYVSDAINVLKNNGLNIDFEDQEQKEDFEAAVLWRSTQKYRLSGLLKLPPFITTISGDPNWPRLVPDSFNLISERFYYDNLNDFYNTSKINFNMTSLQMKNAVNQRVFDVPAAGQFLLTDNKAQIYEVFDGKTDIAVFHDIEEIRDMVDFYLKNDSVRCNMALNAHKKVLNNHTYKHRLYDMITIMKNRYGKGV